MKVVPPPDEENQLDWRRKPTAASKSRRILVPFTVFLAIRTSMYGSLAGQGFADFLSGRESLWDPNKQAQLEILLQITCNPR